jgi:hypothetical protein
VTWSSSKIASFLLWSRRVYPAVRRKYFISAVRSLFLSHCLIVQISLPYKRVGRANVLYRFNLVLLCTKFGFSVLFRSPSNYYNSELYIRRRENLKFHIINLSSRTGVLNLFSSTSTTAVLLSVSKHRHNVSTRTFTVYKYVYEQHPISKEHCSTREHQVEIP